MKNSFVLLHFNNIQILDQFYMVGTQSLSAGGPAVAVSGKTCSVVPGRASIVADGSTKATSFAAQPPTKRLTRYMSWLYFWLGDTDSG
jgi:hypothetical protein